MFHFLGSFSSSVLEHASLWFASIFLLRFCLGSVSSFWRRLLLGLSSSQPQHHMQEQDASTRDAPHSLRLQVGTCWCPEHRLPPTPSHGNALWSKQASWLLPCRASCGGGGSLRTEGSRGRGRWSASWWGRPSEARTNSPSCPRLEDLSFPAFSGHAVHSLLPSSFHLIHKFLVISSHRLCSCESSACVAFILSPLYHLMWPVFQGIAQLPWISSSASSSDPFLRHPGSQLTWCRCSNPSNIGFGNRVLCASIYSLGWILRSPGQSHVLCVFVFPVPNTDLKSKLGASLVVSSA